ncbi:MULTISPECIES: hypothetical protein [unclassified Haloferax]|uniref:hypothetical protein n=1 Tax=unclassified Haloferax TaxID=2625095 RepID=UPI001F43A1ED|nr:MULTISPECIES: hypothetical protein [unclassified Haloferax]
MSLLVSQSHALFAFGTIALLVTLVVDNHDNVGLFALLGALSWGLLGLRAGSLSHLSDANQTAVIVSPEMQIFAFAASLTCLLVVYDAVISSAGSNEVSQ